MAIRFRCAQCKQPIEVDDELADKMARCPFCESVISVPAISELSTETIATARPAGEVPPPPPVATQWGSPVAVAGAPPRFGNTAFVCAICLILSFAAAIIRGGMLMVNEVAPQATASQPADVEAQREALQKLMGNDRFVAAFMLGAAFFGLAATGFGILSLARKETPTWRAWAGIVVGSPLILCQCIVMMLAMSGLAPV